MRIFYITTELINPDTLLPHDGGLANYLCKITTLLAEKGHDINVIVIDKKKTKFVEYKGVNVFFVSQKSKLSFFDKIFKCFQSKEKRKAVKSKAVSKAIHEKIREEHSKKKIDIIQYASFLGMGKEPEADIPSCVRISSYAKLWQKYYNYVDVQEIDNEIEQFRKAKFLYGPSKYIAGFIKNDLKLENDIKIIETPFMPYQGKEDEALYKDVLNRIGDKPYLLFFGTIGLLKGAKEIADSIYEILDKYKELHLVLVGKESMIDSKSMVDMIRNNAKEYSKRVLWYDRQPHSTLFPLIRHAKAVLLPSRVDNLPNTCIESMGLGKIVIGSEGASFEQLIENGQSGLLCKANDSGSIVLAVDTLMNLSNEKINKIEKKAYERSRELLPEKIIPQVIKYYTEVIANWRK